MSTKHTPPFVIFGITVDGEETLCGRYRTLARANKALDDLDFALFSQRGVGFGNQLIGYQLRDQSGKEVRDAN